MCTVARKHLIQLLWLPYIQLYRQLPWFEYFFVDPVGENQLLFETDKHLGIIRSPVLILHAEDDMVVPFLLGKRVCMWCIYMSLLNVVNSWFLEFLCEFRDQDLESVSFASPVFSSPFFGCNPAEHLLSFLCFYTWNNLSTIECIFMKFYIWQFYKKLSSFFSFHIDWVYLTLFYMKTCVLFVPFHTACS